jgi:adenylyltransferase/sulfurtransferase
MTIVPELTPEQFCNRWPERTQSEDVILVDVREPDELELAALSSVVHIPMREIPQRLNELDRERSLVVMCHVGGRSRAVAGYLLTVGFENVFNLAGGIEAWSQDIDPKIPRY